jgi:hypothetical protein
VAQLVSLAMEAACGSLDGTQLEVQHIANEGQGEGAGVRAP